jgi:anaerobic ribonucleoside-triphosphate reductase activating protein
MKYAGIIYNDITAAPGISLSFYTQGCPHHCPGCHNPQTWDFGAGIAFTQETLDRIILRLHFNGIDRPLCILGGESLCPENQFLTRLVVETVRQKSPKTPIYIWTGYTIEELAAAPSPHLSKILLSIDYLIDGPYKQELRDITLQMRGSSNQRILTKDQIREHYWFL